MGNSCKLENPQLPPQLELEKDLNILALYLLLLCSMTLLLFSKHQ